MGEIAGPGKVPVISHDINFFSSTLAFLFRTFEFSTFGAGMLKLLAEFRNGKETTMVKEGVAGFR